MAKARMPDEICTCTLTGRASTPTNATVLICPNIPDPQPKAHSLYGCRSIAVKNIS
jgi:hypothetical protein